MASEKTALAEKIMDKVFEESARVVNMNITDAKQAGIASVLTGLTAFFVAGYRNDFDLCQELTPAYQKRIMPSVSKEEYDNYSYILNNSYTQFREVAIKHQNNSDNWAQEMKSEFGNMLVAMLRANDTNYSRKLLTEMVDRLLVVATKTENTSSNSLSSHVEKEKKGSKFKSIIIPAVFVAICLIYYYITGVHSAYTPVETLYYMQEAHQDDDGYLECYIKVSPGEPDSDYKNMGTFTIYLIDQIDSSGEYMPRYSYMTTASCGYWEWKKLLGSFATNNKGNKFGIIPNGYNRVDCYMAEGKAVGIDGFMGPLDTSDFNVSAIKEVIDFGTNNFVYDGTLYNEVNPNQLDDATTFIMDTLDEMMANK